jgi:hypothetical protein
VQLQPRQLVPPTAQSASAQTGRFQRLGSHAQLNTNTARPFSSRLLWEKVVPDRRNTFTIHYLFYLISKHLRQAFRIEYLPVAGSTSSRPDINGSSTCCGCRRPEKYMKFQSETETDESALVADADALPTPETIGAASTSTGASHSAKR